MVVADTQTFFAIFVANQIDLWLRLRRAVSNGVFQVDWSQSLLPHYHECSVEP
jgi:hypothetical protein